MACSSSCSTATLPPPPSNKSHRARQTATTAGGIYSHPSQTSRDGRPRGVGLERSLRGMGVKWLHPLRTYGAAQMVKTLKEDKKTAEKGLKVIIADGECQLARQRRVRAE